MKNIEILAHEDSPLGLLCLRRRELLSHPGTVVTEITLNHEFLMSSYHTDSERVLTEEGLAAHAGQATARGAGSDGLRVLIGGLGLGYTARAALASDRVARVDVVELLLPVIGWLREGLLPLSEELNASPRLHPVHGDVYAALDRDPGETQEGVVFPEGGYDLILIDVDHSPDDRLGGGNASFYTVDGLTRARKHLADGGVMGVWSYAESSDFSRALHQVFDTVRVVPVRAHNIMVDAEQTDWLFFGS